MTSSLLDEAAVAVASQRNVSFNVSDHDELFPKTVNFESSVPMPGRLTLRTDKKFV